MRKIIKAPVGEMVAVHAYAIFDGIIVFFHNRTVNEGRHEVGWRANVNEKVYGDYLTVTDKELLPSLIEATEILYDQAEDVLINLKDKSAYERGN